MEQRVLSAPGDPSAWRWLETHASTLFAAVRQVVPDSVCTYDLGLELAAMIGHRWEAFDAGRDRTRMAWSIRLAGELIARAIARGVVPTTERRRTPAPLTLTVSNADLHRLSELARTTPLDLDADAVDALAALGRSAPPAHLLSSLDPSHLIRRASSDVLPGAR